MIEGLKNPDAFNYQGVNANQMAETLGNKMAPYAQQLLSTGAIKKHQHPYAYQAILSITQGVDPNIVMAAMQNNPEALKDPAARKLYNDMQSMLDQTLQEYKFSDIAPVGSESYNRGRMITARGFSKGIGNVSIQGAQDQYGMQVAAEERARKRAEEESDKTSKSIFGSEISVIGEEGSVFQDEPLVSMNPLFNSNGAIQLYDSKSAPRPSGMYVTPTGGISKTAASPASKIDVENANKKQQEINKAINQYRKENNIPISGSGKQTQKQVFERMKYDNDFMKNYLSTTGHKIVPIVDVSTSNSILNQAFYTNAGATTFAELGKNYSKDMESGIGLQEIAKRNGLSQDQITSYIQNSGIRVGLDRTSGLYTVQIPTKMKNIGTQNAPNWTADEGATYKTVGFSYSNSHKAPVYAINAIRQADNTNAKDPVPLTKGLKRDEATGLYQRRVYNPKDKKVYIAYYENISGDNPVGYAPLTTTTKNGQQYHISGSDYRAMELNDIQDSEIINTEYKNVQSQSESLGKVNIN